MNNKVAIFYHYIAHYRRAVFEGLSSSEDYNFTIYSDSKSNLSALTTVENQENIRWKKINNYWIGKNLLFQPRIISNAIFGNESTVIYLGNIWFISTWIASVIARVRGKKVLMWTIGCLEPEEGFKGLIRRRFYSLAHGLLLYGNKAKIYLSEAGYPDEKMRVIYNSLDYAEQNEISKAFSRKSRDDMRRSLFSHPELPIILVLGRMTKRVNYGLILSAVKQLHNESYPVSVLIVGDGSEKESVIKLVDEQGLNDYVNIYGACFSEQILGCLINSADITVGPGHIGLACIHSLTYGTPVISHDNPYSNLGPEFEIVRPGVNGEIFKQNDASDLAKVIRNWLAKHTDRESIERTCKNSVYPEYTPSYQVKEIVLAIKNLQEGSACGSR